MNAGGSHGTPSNTKDSALTGAEQQSVGLWDEGIAAGASDFSLLWKPSVTSLHTEGIRFFIDVAIFIF